MSYPSYFPKGCPPLDASTDRKILYRFCNGMTPVESDFYSYYQTDNTRTGDIRYYGLSVFASRDDCIESVRKYPYMRKFQSIAKGETDATKGAWKNTPTTKNPRHYTWWVCDDVRPELFFSSDYKVSDI